MKLFISYAKADEKYADVLRAALSKHAIQVWNPDLQIAPGENWALKYGKALENSDAVVVLLSPDAAKSDAVAHEIQYALLSPQFRDRLIPVLVRPTDDVPWILRTMKMIRATKDADETAQKILHALRRAPATAGR